MYNEFSLQHELGIYLRSALPDMRVQFERNVSFFFSDKTRFTKREIDISTFSPADKRLAFAIELKYPRNGQHPEQMFSFCKDIAFAEELVAAGFPRSAFVVFADDHLFYRGPTEGIYGFFRGAKPIHGRIQKPTGKKTMRCPFRDIIQSSGSRSRVLSNTPSWSWEVAANPASQWTVTSGPPTGARH